jgi:hypothetical protein
MDNPSLWISLAALVVSVGALLHTILRSASQSQLQEVEERADLLTRIVELKLEYEQEVNHLSWLADVAHRLELPDANEITRIAILYKDFVAMTQGHYDELMKIPKASKTTLLNMAHHIDALRVRVKTETARLQLQKERIQLLLDLSCKEKA